jgi:hypothetical protein
MMNFFVKKALTFCCIFFFTLVGCNSNKSSSNDSPGSPTPPPETPNDNKPQQPTTEPASKDKEGLEFQSLGIVREFGGTDNAAMFGVQSKSGKLQINKVEGPAFIKTYRVGELNQTSISKLFLNTSKPLSTDERQNLISEFNGATVIYTEGYSGNLCSNDEIIYDIKTTGRIDETNIEVIFHFEALPNPNGNCDFHVFGTITKYIK